MTHIAFEVVDVFTTSRFGGNPLAVVLDALASGYGAGLTLRPYAYAPAALLLFGAEAAASRAWLARFRFGPLEWIWRMATYARIQPLRRRAVETVSM